MNGKKRDMYTGAYLKFGRRLAKLQEIIIICKPNFGKYPYDGMITAANILTRDIIGILPTLAFVSNPGNVPVESLSYTRAMEQWEAFNRGFSEKFKAVLVEFKKVNNYV